MLFDNFIKSAPGCKYKDQIWKIYDDDSGELIWENELRDEMWKSDNDPDSEYNKMMELERETDFYHKMDELDYWFEHRIVRVHTKYKNKGNEDVIKYSEDVIKYSSLIEEFVGT